MMGEVIKVNFLSGEREPEKTRDQLIGEAVLYNHAAIEVQKDPDAPQEEINDAWDMAMAATLELTPEERIEAEQQLRARTQ